jgi:hypothetical protein
VRAVFASFAGRASPLRHQPTIGSCQFGGHAIWWDVNAASEAEALELLPSYIAANDRGRHRHCGDPITDAQLA